MSQTHTRQLYRDVGAGNDNNVIHLTLRSLPPDYFKNSLEGNGGKTKKVHWDPEVIDNEHLGRKKSKCCCIFHPSSIPDAMDAEPKKNISV